MIVFRYLLFIIFIGIGAYVLYATLYALFNRFFASSAKVKVAKFNQEYAINEEEADIMIEQVVKKKSLNDRYAEMEADKKFFSEDQKKVKKALEKKKPGPKPKKKTTKKKTVKKKK